MIAYGVLAGESGRKVGEAICADRPALLPTRRLLYYARHAAITSFSQASSSSHRTLGSAHGEREHLIGGGDLDPGLLARRLINAQG